MADLVFGLAKSAVEGTMTMAKSAIEEEKKLRKGVQLDLMLISDEFEMMHSFLNVSQDHVVTDDVARTVVRQVRNMALDVEDCIESVVHLDGKSNWWRRMLPSCVPAAAAAADLDAAVADIELLKARVEAMGQRNLRYSHIGDSGPKPTEQHQMRQKPASIAATSNTLVMAREAAKHCKQVELGGLLVSKKEDVLQLQVISVLGTRNDLAMIPIKKAYDDPEICSSFRRRAWVKLMHPFNPHEFIRSLLTQFYKNCWPQQEADVLELTEVMVATEGLLIEEFKKQMSNHKYLVVLEDVSTMFDWEAVTVYLPDENNGSCIVVHTQQPGIASSCVGHPHRVSELESFSPDHSVYVFFKQDAQVEETIMERKLNTAREWLDKHQLVGHEEDISTFECTRYHERVVSVWGMSGVGKSFVVKHMYCRWQVGWGNSHKFGWVDVSHPFDLMEFSQSLLLDLNPGYFQNGMMSTVKDPIQACREYLRKHTYFIVIDGLQSTEEWDMINAALEFSASSANCMIVITNEEHVAKHCASDKDSVRNIKGLGIDRAMELFEKKMEGGTDVLNEEERRILMHKCGGLPKVICAVADILSPRSWLHYDPDPLRKDNLLLVLEANALYITESLDYMLAWLASYLRSCPDFLKPCIFYLSMFPLKHTLRRRRLVRRWIAEGYARDSEESTAEENGEMSFSKLVNLSMTQVPRTIIHDWRVPLCQVNGFLQEYTLSRSMEENLVFALKGHCRKNLHRTSGRHLAIDKSWDRDKSVFESIDFSRLRSLTVFGKWESFFISNKMKHLRVLDLEDASSGVADGDVEQMVKLLPRLKFLSLRRCQEVTRLPDSLGDLRQLQTLDIRETSVAKLPRSISKLEKLQYIRAGTTTTSPAPVDDDDDKGTVQASPPPSAAESKAGVLLVPNWLSKLCVQRRLGDDDNGSHNGVKVPRGIGHLSNLHTLGVVNISAACEEGVLEELKNLTQLHKLGVSGINQSNSQQLFAAISALAHLESLSLEVQLNEDGCLDCLSSPPVNLIRSLKLFGLGRKVPGWVMALQGLRKLHVQMTMIPKEGIDPLMGIPKLESLRLSVSELQDDELHMGTQKFNFYLNLLEISCSSRSQQLKIAFHEEGYGYSGCAIKVLRIRCRCASSLWISGLQHIRSLLEVWLSGPCDDTLRQNMERELALNPRHQGPKPVLRLEEPGVSMPWLMTSS